MPTVLKSGRHNLLEPTGPVQACNGIAFTFTFILFMIKGQCVSCGAEIVSSNTIHMNYILQRTDICHNFVLAASNEIQHASVSEIIGQMTDGLGYV